MLGIPIVTQFNGDGIKKAIKSFKQLETASDKVKFVLKAGAVAGVAAFAAIGTAAYQAGQALAGFAKMAADDEKAQKQLALSIRASTKATDEQIASVEELIDRTQRQVGIADDELRPAYARIIRSTRDFEKAERLLNNALNVSAATGKPLAQVVQALTRAYDGSTTALGKLGLGYDKAKLKGMDFNDIQKDIEKRFSGAALANAETFEGTMARFRITMDELKETLGAAILPYMKKLAEYGIQIADAFGKDGVAGAMKELQFILKTLLYDQNGNLNQAGKTLNSIADKADKLAAVFNFGQRLASATPVGQLANTIGNRFGFDPTPSLGSVGSLATQINPVLLQRQPENAIVVNVYAGVGNPAEIGKAVQGSLRAWERRSGGR
jgi:tetratricopeptide (TPR) repeat protein